MEFPDFPGYTFDRWIPASELDTALNGGGSTQFAEFTPEGGIHSIFVVYNKKPLDPAPADPKPTTPATPPTDNSGGTDVQDQTPPATQADKEDLSATRNQLLAQVDKSRLTDEQKGELAVNIAFAETAEELDKLKADLTSLTANQSAPASADKPATADKPAPSAAKTLPTTGELTTEALTAMGVSLVLFGLGLAKARKTK